MSDPRFPTNFLWGASTSSHQIEGSLTADGRAESIWDRFAATPGKIHDGSDARVACDHYRRWREDVDLLRWLGVGSYRFSIAWPRVIPEGTGAVNEAGLDFYDRLVDALLEAKIRPNATLYHWDLPQALEDRGGWASRETAEAFVKYADAVTARLGDRVAMWSTHNEPWCAATLGYEEGAHAPGRHEPAAALAAAHHLLLSHGWALEPMRENAPGADLGIVLNLTPAYPESPSREDEDAARWFDGFFNRWYLDPIFLGRYPEDAIADRREQGHLPAGPLPFVQPGDLDAISRPLDFLGVNFYSRVVMRQSGPGQREAVPQGSASDRTDMDWEVYPDGLHHLLVRLAREYPIPALYITENGAAYADAPDSEGVVADARRVAFLKSHLDATSQAIEDGVPIRGYYVWSLLDNFEWAHGFDRRFGLIWVDYETQKRIPKQSAHWYRETIARSALSQPSSPNLRELS